MSLIQALITQIDIRLEVAKSNFNNAQGECIDNAIEELNKAESAKREILKLARDCGRLCDEKKS